MPDLVIEHHGPKACAASLRSLDARLADHINHGAQHWAARKEAHTVVGEGANCSLSRVVHLTYGGQIHDANFTVAISSYLFPSSHEFKGVRTGELPFEGKYQSSAEALLYVDVQHTAC